MKTSIRVAYISLLTKHRWLKTSGLQYVKRQGLRLSLQFTQCKQEAAESCQLWNHDITCLSDWAIYRRHSQL